MNPRHNSISKILRSSNHIYEELRQRMLRRSFRRGEVITDEQMLRNYAFFLIKGMARGFYIRKGRDRTYAFAFEEDFLGVPNLLFKQHDTSPAIEFLESTQLLMIPRNDIASYLQSVNDGMLREVYAQVMELLFYHVQEVEELMFMFQSMTARERYEWFTRRYPAVLERASITQIASFLGVTKETLYRIRADKYGTQKKRKEIAK